MYLRCLHTVILCVHLTQNCHVSENKIWHIKSSSPKSKIQLTVLSILNHIFYSGIPYIKKRIYLSEVIFDRTV